MYASKSLTGATGVGGAGMLAQTGMDVTNVLFWAIAALVMIIVAATVLGFTRARPSMMTAGPKLASAPRWSIRRK